MIIENNKVVSFHYKLIDANGDVLEETNAGAPFAYLQGDKSLLPNLETEMLGKSAGDNYSVTLTPEQAYGPRTDNAVQRVSRKHIVDHKKIKKFKAGMHVQVNTSEGPREVVVIKAGLKTIDVDTNHPYAGKTVTFEVEIQDVRLASDDEISHGHAHGPGGHQH